MPFDFNHKVGLGWTLNGLTVEGSQGTAWHDGEYPPFVSQMVVLNKQKLGVVILSNCVEAESLTDELAVRALKMMLEAKFGIQESLETKKPQMSPTVVVPDRMLEQYSGTYTVLGQITRFIPKENRLSAQLIGHQLDLLPISQDTFIPHLVFLLLFQIDLPQFPVTFSRIGNQDVGLLGGLTYPIPLEKIQPVDIPQAWKSREGEYVQENPDGQFDFNHITLGEKDGFLQVDMKVTFAAFDIKNETFKVAILPLSEEDAMVPGLFYGDGGTLHAAEGEGGTHIYYSGYWFKKKDETVPTPCPTPVKSDSPGATKEIPSPVGSMPKS